ncbi:acyl carrier protein [Sinorhizobium meliloti]|uniref:phosphopantetheine-binding protein n=1 Tax=Rhizobium meliloti TaxID=382 RepID=UPI001296597F|nr:phosphopantetheine-binding protein [Sinorhizobium meliloti]MQW30252.1 acyl carrier protein [Sinorhizobium meliloti]
MLKKVLSKDEARDALRKALKAVLEEEIPPLTDNIVLFEKFQLDSMSMLETLIELEEMLGFSVDPEELDVKDFETVGGYTDFLMTVAAA